MDAGTAAKTGVAATGGIIGILYGEWTALLNFLVIAVVFDYITGVAAAWLRKEFNAQFGVIGIARKVFIFVVVAVAHIADQAIGAEVIMTATIFFYFANEIMSIIENSERIGLPVPDVLKKAIEIMKSKGDGK